MKNSVIKRLMCAAVSVLMLFSFCSCGVDTISSALDVPTIVSVRDGFVYWEEVPGANSYVLKINEVQEEISSSLKCDIEAVMGSLLEPGVPTELHISIKAKGNQMTTADSEWSEETVHVYTRMETTPVTEPAPDTETEPVTETEPEEEADPGVVNASEVNRYKTQPASTLVSNASELQSAFKDNNYWYYVYYLGDITRVPLEDRQAEHFDGVLERTLSFTYSTVETETISNSAEYATQKCDSWTKELSQSLSETNSTSVKIAGSVDVAVANLDAEATKGVEKTLERGFVNAFSGSTNETWTESYERAHEYSETVTTSTEVTFTKSVKAGYYRYILMGTVSVYAVVIYDPATGEACVTQISDVKASYRDFDYSETPVFERDTDYGKLSFDLSAITEFVEPETDYGEATELPGEVIKPEEIIEDGSKETPYRLGAPEDFKKIRENDASGVYFVLTADIDFTDKEYLYSPVADFKGIFDGCGYAVTNWTYSGNGAQIGFFMKNSGTVKNVIFDGCTIEKATNTNGETLQVGIVCGVNVGRITNVRVIRCALADCHMGDVETNTNSTVIAGLLVGENNNGGSVSCSGVENSEAYAVAKTQYKDAWAIAAGLVGKNDSSIENCYTRGNYMSATTAGAERFLGLQKADVFACASGLVGELCGSGSLKYSIAYSNGLATDAAGGKTTEYMALLVSKNDGAVFNCYSQTASRKPAGFDTTPVTETDAPVTETVAPETEAETAVESEAETVAEIETESETVAEVETVDPAVTDTEEVPDTEVVAETENCVVEEPVPVEEDTVDYYEVKTDVLIAAGSGSKSGIGLYDDMALSNFSGFSKELWKDTANGAIIIHENMK